MGKVINWNKVGAIATIVGCVIGGIGIIVAIFLSFRSQPSAQPNQNIDPGTVTMHPWTLWIMASIYLAGVVLAGFLHWKAATVVKPIEPPPPVPPPPPVLSPPPRPTSLSDSAMAGFLDAPGGPPKLKFTLKEGVAGLLFGEGISGVVSPDFAVVFHLRLINQREPVMTIKGWDLALVDGYGEYIGTGYVQNIAKKIGKNAAFARQQAGMAILEKEKETFDKDLGKEVSLVPMDVLAPVEGWLLFTVSLFTSKTLHHLFGATFTLTAIDDADGKWTHVLKPSPKWLTAVDFSFQESK